MDKYLLFFGKSQAFTIEAFGVSGHISDFDTVIPDFDLLESQWLNIDRSDNKPVLAWYRFSKGSKKYTLLKLYSHAQAKDGNRIEGSIYGVAFLATGLLSIDLTNIKLLDALKSKFSELCLSGLKFKSADFMKPASAVWRAFLEQSGFEKIQAHKSTDDEPESTRPLFFHVSNPSDAAQIGDKLRNKTDKIYFSEDLDHLVRYHKRSPAITELFVKKNGKFISYSNSLGENPSEATGARGNTGKNYPGLTADHIRFEKEIGRLNRSLALKNQEFKKAIIISGSLILLLLLIVIYLFLKGPQVVEKRIEVRKQPEEELRFDITGYLMKDLLRDTAKVKRLSEVLDGFMKIKTAKDTAKLRQLTPKVLKSAAVISIDTVELKKALKHQIAR